LENVNEIEQISEKEVLKIDLNNENNFNEKSKNENEKLKNENEKLKNENEKSKNEKNNKLEEFKKIEDENLNKIFNNPNSMNTTEPKKEEKKIINKYDKEFLESFEKEGIKKSKKKEIKKKIKTQEKEKPIQKPTIEYSTLPEKTEEFNLVIEKEFKTSTYDKEIKNEKDDLFKGGFNISNNYNFFSGNEKSFYNQKSNFEMEFGNKNNAIDKTIGKKNVNKTQKYNDFLGKDINWLNENLFE
jgi:hypothetical protein